MMSGGVLTAAYTKKLDTRNQLFFDERAVFACLKSLSTEKIKYIHAFNFLITCMFVGEMFVFSVCFGDDSRIKETSTYIGSNPRRIDGAMVWQ